MDKEKIKIKEFDKEQLELLLKDLQDIDKFTVLKDGAFKYELGKYQANLLVNCIKKYKEVIDKISEIICEIDELRKTTGGYPSNYIDSLLEILKEVEK